MTNQPLHQTPNPVDQEQAVLDQALDRLRGRRSSLTVRARALLMAGVDEAGGPAYRDAVHSHLTSMISASDAAEQGLYLGRLVTASGSSVRLGRVGVPGKDADDEALLVDWRAPAARPFFTATRAEPHGVRLRRHVRTRNDHIFDLDDDLLDEGPVPQGIQLVGTAALLRSLRADRSGRLQAVVGTLQRDQDAIIRTGKDGMVVIQGGPGTGKTVVAMHRIAYLLYTYPELLRGGVLVVGPTPAWVSYVEDVLPALGENQVAFVSADTIYPGVLPDLVERPDVAQIKGRDLWPTLLRRAVEALQAPSDHSWVLSLHGEQLRFDQDFADAVRTASRDTGQPHNQAKTTFRRLMTAEVATRLARIIGDIEDRFEEELADDIDSVELDRAAVRDLVRLWGPDVEITDRGDQMRAEVAEAEANWLEALPRTSELAEFIDALWPSVQPTELLDRLWADPATLEAVSEGLLTKNERAALRRLPNAGWSRADLPLLDEAAELLGSDRSRIDAQERSRRAREVGYAQDVLDLATQSADDDETLGSADVIDAEALACHFREVDQWAMRERAAQDRDWVFGHVVVDEAQDLSPMMWRLLHRRCPSGSFTVCGDLMQRTSAPPVATWGEVLGSGCGRSWKLFSLRVNYRSTRSIAEAVAEIAERSGRGDLAAPQAIVQGPAVERIDVKAPVTEGLRGVVEDLLGRDDSGMVAVLCAESALAACADALEGLVPTTSGEQDLRRRLTVMTGEQAKGLEFDTVVVVDPVGIEHETPFGAAELYVAMSRPTRRLVVLHRAMRGAR